MREYDRDHQIGHSYLLSLKDVYSTEDVEEKLRDIWNYEIIPLLQEYFYGSPSKLKKVLNDQFIKIENDTYVFKPPEDIRSTLKRLAEG